MFDWKTVSRLLRLLDFFYAPVSASAALALSVRSLTPGRSQVSETVFGAFACRRIGTSWHLLVNTQSTCYDPHHRRYMYGSAVAVVLFCAGVPVLYAGLLFHYRIPAAARKLARTAALRQLVDLAWQARVPGNRKRARLPRLHHT